MFKSSTQNLRIYEIFFKMRKINIELTKSATNLRTNTSIDNKDNVNNFKSADDKSGLNKTRIKNFK